MNASSPDSGRRPQAARNDRHILDAARSVFLANPDAPIADVAKRANVGISALYRRYRSKDHLLQQLALDGLRRHNAQIEVALAYTGDQWEAFSAYLGRSLADGGGALSRKLSGRFTVTPELAEEGFRALSTTQQLIERVLASGAVRPGIQATDISMLSEALQSITIGIDERDRELRLRYLRVVLDGLRAPGTGVMPGEPPSPAEMRARFTDPRS